MRLTVNEVSKRCGVSVRTLHYYDEMGLLKPCEVTESGYRLYSERELKRLQQILFLRELDMPVKEIPSMLVNSEASQSDMLIRHRALLTLKRDRLSALIDLCERLIRGEDTMDFKPFDSSEINKAKEEYAKEAKQRWGDSSEYRESEKRSGKRTDEETTVMEKEQDEIFRAFAACVGKAPDSDEARKLVIRWQEHISKWHYPCSREMLACLGQMYTGDERFMSTLDGYGEGTARIMSDAIAAYCGE